MIKPESLCFHCDNFNCRWRKCLKAVPGWNACPTQVKSGKKYLPSWIVMQCPEFQREKGYSNDAEWQQIKNNNKRTIYHDLADIYTICPESKILIQQAQEHYETEIRKLEVRFENIRKKYSDLYEKYRSLEEILEVEENAAD